MNRQAMILGGLGLALVAVMVYQFGFAGGSTPPPKPKPAATAAAAPGTPRPATPRPPSSPAGRVVPGKLERTEIDVQALLSEVQQVRFDYARVAISRNPMTPLVGGELKPMDDATASTIGKTSRNIYTEVINKRVTGIVWDEHSPVAVVDEEIVYPGFEYPYTGVRVVAIRPNAVVFQLEDTEIPVELEE